MKTNLTMTLSAGFVAALTILAAVAVQAEPAPQAKPIGSMRLHAAGAQVKPIYTAETSSSAVAAPKSEARIALPAETPNVGPAMGKVIGSMRLHAAGAQVKPIYAAETSSSAVAETTPVTAPETVAPAAKAMCPPTLFFSNVTHTSYRGLAACQVRELPEQATGDRPAGAVKTLRQMADAGCADDCCAGHGKMKT